MAAKLIGGFLFASEYQTIAGISRTPAAFVSNDLQIPIEEVQHGIAELEAAGIVMHDPADGWTWCVSYLTDFPVCGPSQTKAATSALESVPADCCWRRAFLQKYGKMLGIKIEEVEPDSDTLHDTHATPSQHPRDTLSTPSLLRDGDGDGDGNGNERKGKGDARGEGKDDASATKPESKPPSIADTQIVMRYLNQKTGHKFRYDDGSLDPIASRMREGATIEECKAVIDASIVRCKGDPDALRTLTPALIFRKESFWDRAASTRKLAGMQPEGHA